MSFTGVVASGTVARSLDDLPGETINPGADAVRLRRDTAPDGSRGVIYVVVVHDVGVKVVDHVTFNDDHSKLADADQADAYARGVADTYADGLAAEEGDDIRTRLQMIGELASDSEDDLAVAGVTDTESLQVLAGCTDAPDPVDTGSD